MKNKRILVARSSMPTYEEYIEAIKPLWETHWLTNMGVYHKELEKQLSAYLNTPETSLMVNGHLALELTIQAMGFKPGSEVITTPFTFISTTHAIVRNNLTPVFCDVKESDGTIDENKIEQLITDKTAAIVPVHVYGHICDVEAIAQIAEKYNLKVIYDAAHAFGEAYKGVGIGNFGDASVFSFHATKVFNTIEGGAVTFANHDLYEKLYNLKNFGIRGEELVTEVGANAKMNEFSAIMGLCNLKHIDEEIEKRKENINLYIEKLKNVSGIKLFKEREFVKKNYAYLPILVDSDQYFETRDQLYSRLRMHDVYARKYFYPLTPNQKCYANQFSHTNLKIAEKLAKQILALPLFADLQSDQINDICGLIQEKENMD